MQASAAGYGKPYPYMVPPKGLLRVSFLAMVPVGYDLSFWMG
jgi:hypothetical protein